MPPKVRYTREEIANTAFGMVRKHGEEFLSARSLAAELGTSTAPIFTAFSGIEEVRDAVLQLAKERYGEYARAGASMDPPFKGYGLQFIRFAKEEPRLFRMLFMREDGGGAPTHYLPATYEQEETVRKTAQNAYGWDEERAKRIYNHLAVYVYGLAVLCAGGNYVFTDEDISRMLREEFFALKRYEEETYEEHH